MLSDHRVAIDALPPIHQDLFDRLLVAAGDRGRGSHFSRKTRWSRGTQDRFGWCERDRVRADSLSPAIESNPQVILIATRIENLAVGVEPRDLKAFLDVLPVDDLFASLGHNNHRFAV